MSFRRFMAYFVEVEIKSQLSAETNQLLVDL